VSQLQIHPLAETELEAAARFYEAKLAGLGEAFITEVSRCFDRALDAPESGVACYGRFRRLIVRRFPYAVFYEALPQAVLILAVAHQRRKPGYWRKRS